MTFAEGSILALSLAASGATVFALQRWGGLDFRSLIAGRGRSKKRRPHAPFGRDVRALPASFWFVCGAVVFLSAQLGAPFAAMLPTTLVGPRTDPLFLAVTGACAFGFGTLIALFLLYAIAPRVGPDAGTRCSWRDIPVGLTCAVCIAPFYTAAAFASQCFVRDVLGHSVSDLAHASLGPFVEAPFGPTGLLIALTAVVLAPMVEECVYRVFLTSCLSRLLAGTEKGGASGPRAIVLAVLTTSALFAVAHAAGKGPVPWVAVPGLFVLALGLGLAYERTRRLGVPIVIHAVFNLTNLLLAAAQHSR